MLPGLAYVDAYDPGDPKNPAYTESVFAHADDHRQEL